MKRYKVVVLLVLMVVGYASINTSLELLGETNLAYNEKDFRIEISKVKINEEERNETISKDKQEFIVSESGSISYTVTNYSYQYDAVVNLVCDPSDDVEIEQIGVLDAQSKRESIVVNKKEESITCRIEIEKVSRTEYAESMCPYEVGKEWTYSYRGSEQEFIVPCDGEYKFELWGASGGNAFGINNNYGGKGAYVSGVTDFDSDDLIYINIGGKGEDAKKIGAPYDGNNRAAVGGYNGGGDATGFGSCVGSGGGGSTHISLKSGTLSTLVNDKSAILLVASAGGGASLDIGSRLTYEGTGGGAGIKEGYKGETRGNTQCLANGATQLAGGTSCASKLYGVFGASVSINDGIEIDGGGGGSGYYGGGSAVCSGGGGSSYINDGILFTLENPNHILKNTIVADGRSDMPSHDGLTTIKGNTGNGYAKITYLGI